MANIWIIGAGHFGSNALERLSQNWKYWHFLLVDSVKENLDRLKGDNFTLEHADGAVFLKQQLTSDNAPDWIIPALPIHLAAEWCLLRLGLDRYRRVELPAEIESCVPNPLRGSTGDIFASHARFICPNNCPEPGNLCTATGKTRERNLFEILSDIRVSPFKSLVIRSHQLGPGVGGYRPEQLFRLFEQVESAKSDVLVSTSCRCHGVITGIGGV